MKIVDSFLRRNKSTGKSSRVKSHSRNKKLKKALAISGTGVALLGLGYGGKKLLKTKSSVINTIPNKKSSLTDKLLDKVDNALGQKLRNSPELLSNKELGQSARLELIKKLKEKFKF